MAQLQMLYSEWLDQNLVGWIQVNLLPQSLAWLVGFGTNHCLLFSVQHWHHHIETRQIYFLIKNDKIQKNFQSIIMLSWLSRCSTARGSSTGLFLAGPVKVEVAIFAVLC